MKNKSESFIFTRIVILREYLFFVLKKLGIYSKYIRVFDWIFFFWIFIDMK